ncbi:VanZ family protein [Pelagicoccus sp. SDUM812003]|uniref:VanZ family protein n=1 Tax=Pelagicoccus sp. SDUM812003 TaxID=3041267 RepID=UPI00280C8401|nr:VanZ family protein [Pelagicoccus sp. SDUM812003]MDQ8204438.1 VanZ family protein [Pelagicoccus sp. SDUM812003]
MSLQPSFRRGVFLALLTATLCFGWWPFNFVDSNDVSVAPEGGAARFNAEYERGSESSRGLLMSKGILDTRGWNELSVLVELKGRPRGGGLGVFLELIEEEAKGELPPLLLAQWQEHLALRSRRLGGADGNEYSEIGYKGCFSSGEFFQIALSSTPERTGVYIDGELVEMRRDFVLVDPMNAFVGRVVIGNSADGTRPFTGEIRRVAFFDEALRSIGGRIAQGVPELSFDFSNLEPGELQSGLEVQGLQSGARLSVAKRRFLNPIQTDRWERHGYRRDIVVNSLGFIPIGLCFAAMGRRRIKSWIGVLVFVGFCSFALSFAIEWAQGYLVHRDSSQLDVLLNTVSGMLAVLVPRRLVLFL